MFVNIATISILVNIEVDRYAADMARARSTALDPEIRLLAALADPTRLAIVRQLAVEQETCACDFTACCDVAQPTVSHHLKVLVEAGLLEREKRGTWAWFRLVPSRLDDVAAIFR